MVKSIHFQFGKEPVIYAGDLKNEDAVIEGLLVQKDPTNEAIEEEDGPGVRNVIENSEAVAVYICEFTKASSMVLVSYINSNA